MNKIKPWLLQGESSISVANVDRNNTQSVSCLAVTFDTRDTPFLFILDLQLQGAARFE